MRLRRILVGAVVAVLVAVALFAAFVAVSTRVATEEFVFLPDPAQDVSRVVRVAGEAPDPSVDAPQLLYVAIGYRRASLFDTLFGRLERGAELVPEHAVVRPGQSDQDAAEEDRAVMSESQEVAAAVALERLGEDVEVERDGAEVGAVAPGSPAASAGLEPSDVIVAVDGRPVDGVRALRSALGRVRPGDRVELGLRDGGATRTVTSGTTASPPDDPPRRAVLGIEATDAVDIELPREVEYQTGSIGGPSAGLAFALEIYDSLTGRRLTRGHRVAVTGSIDLDGNVGPIGGIRQKAVGAAEGGADVFLVPLENLADALETAPKGLEVIPVATFDEALEALERLPPRAA